jgi:hypothetical protein
MTHDEDATVRHRLAGQRTSEEEQESEGADGT